MKKIICLFLFTILMFSPAFAMQEGDTNFDTPNVENDMSDSVAEMETLRVEQERKRDEAAGKKGPSNTQEVTDVLESESTYDD